MKFQQSFIKWACCKCVSEVPVYLGGAGAENVTACIKVCSNDPSDDVDSLRNTQLLPAWKWSKILLHHA